MHALTPVVAQELAALLDSFQAREVLARLDAPSDGGALEPGLAGVLRARAMASLERFRAAYDVLGEVKQLRDLGESERLAAQVLTARVLRFASPLVDHALEVAVAAAERAERAGDASRPQAVEARVEAALLFARKRCRKLAEAELARARTTGVSLERVHAAEAEVALEFDERAIAKSAYEAALAIPGAGERVGRLGLARLHTVLGEFDAAAASLTALGERPAGDLAVKRAWHRLYAAKGEWTKVAEAIASFLEVAPDADSARRLMLERASAFYRAGAIAEARAAWAAIAEDGDDWASRAASRTLAKLEKSSAKRTRLQAFPSVAQLRNHCGPASVELCMRFFGVSADQVAVAREIKHPDGGTPVHKMRWYMDQSGFTTRRVAAELPTLKAILDAGVPVIVEEDYSTTRHVAVAVGYDDRREVLEVQDPMTHEIRETPYEELDKIREFSNHGALVAVPKDRADLVAKLDAAGAVECAYMTKTDLAWEAHDQERHDDADRLADEAIALHEPYELAWVYKFVRARERFLAERTEENKETLGATINKILALWPNDEWPQQFLGRVFMIEERWDEALPAFERARDRDPDDANNWCSIGDCQLELGEKGRAREAFEEALKRDPGHVRANENLANVAFEGGDLALAALLNACARELALENPFNEHVNGRILGKKGDPRGAASAYARALELAPGTKFYSVERARHLAAAGDVDEALASLRALADVDAEDTYVPVQLADLAYEHDRLDACLAACALVESRDPETPTPRAIGGAARTKAGDLEGGVALLREAIRKRPTYAWAYRELGRAFSRAGRHDDAVAAAAAAAGLVENPLATFYLGDALARGGHGGDAMSYLRRAAESGSLGERELDRVASVFASADGEGAAHRLFQSLEERHPRDRNVLRAHARLLCESFWYPGVAAPILARLGEIAPDDPFALAKAGDDLMDESIAAEARGEALLREAVSKGPAAIYPRRLLARQLNARGRYDEALGVLEPLPADEETMEDRVVAHVGLRRDDDAKRAIDAWVATMPEDARGPSRRPHDFAIAKAHRRWEEALALAEALSEDEGELADDGELGRWEEERFGCLAALGRVDEAYDLGIAQCADAEDKGRLAYEALARGAESLAFKLADEALEEDENEVHALHVRARAAERRDDVDEAMRIWERMRAISSWHIHVENLGRLALASGDFARAADLLERAVATGHVCPVSLELRGALRLLSGDREGARADLTRARACLPLVERDVSEQLDAMLAALEGRGEEARALLDRYVAREASSPVDRRLYAKIREAM